jgi:hypothetical protein
LQLQRFLRSVSDTGAGRHWTGTDRPVLFYGVIDTQVVLNGPKSYDILKILIKYVIKYKMSINYAIKQPGPVDAGPVPIGASAQKVTLN